mmetsp:Transcript_62630/g.111279  ORF Transcript_62630/g.111279 Transcript_62630/m.111279 type:complete len:203 (+) Transcript_62630:1419-2027(+)
MLDLHRHPLARKPMNIQRPLTSVCGTGNPRSCVWLPPGGSRAHIESFCTRIPGTGTWLRSEVRSLQGRVRRPRCSRLPSCHLDCHPCILCPLRRPWAGTLAPLHAPWSSRRSETLPGSSWKPILETQPDSKRRLTSPRLWSHSTPPQAPLYDKTPVPLNFLHCPFEAALRAAGRRRMFGPCTSHFRHLSKLWPKPAAGSLQK